MIAFEGRVVHITLMSMPDLNDIAETVPCRIEVTIGSLMVRTTRVGVLWKEAVWCCPLGVPNVGKEWFMC
jgi:hypothetical protein